jgi:hypothetical protein
MKRIISRTFAAAILAVMVSVQAGARTHRESITVVSPSHLPESAQHDGEAMYLHYTGDGRAVLYLEQDQGRALAILDVSNPAAVRTVGRVSVAARSPYDFVASMRDSAVMIRYRDQSGFAVFDFKNFKKPVLTEVSQFQHPAQTEVLGHDGLLVASTTRSSAQTEDSQYEVFDISNPSEPMALAAVEGVHQRLERKETGTLFLLGNSGLTLIRRPDLEEEYDAELNQQRGN